MAYAHHPIHICRHIASISKKYIRHFRFFLQLLPTITLFSHSYFILPSPSPPSTIILQIQYKNLKPNNMYNEEISDREFSSYVGRSGYVRGTVRRVLCTTTHYDDTKEVALYTVRRIQSGRRDNHGRFHDGEESQTISCQRVPSYPGEYLTPRERRYRSFIFQGDDLLELPTYYDADTGQFLTDYTMVASEDQWRATARRRAAQARARPSSSRTTEDNVRRIVSRMRASGSRRMESNDNGTSSSTLRASNSRSNTDDYTPRGMEPNMTGAHHARAPASYVSSSSGRRGAEHNMTGANHARAPASYVSSSNGRRGTEHNMTGANHVRTPASYVSSSSGRRGTQHNMTGANYARAPSSYVSSSSGRRKILDPTSMAGTRFSASHVPSGTSSHRTSRASYDSDGSSTSRRRSSRFDDPVIPDDSVSQTD